MPRGRITLRSTASSGAPPTGSPSSVPPEGEREGRGGSCRGQAHPPETDMIRAIRDVLNCSSEALPGAATSIDGYVVRRREGPRRDSTVGLVLSYLLLAIAVVPVVIGSFGLLVARRSFGVSSGADRSTSRWGIVHRASPPSGMRRAPARAVVSRLTRPMKYPMKGRRILVVEATRGRFGPVAEPSSCWIVRCVRLGIGRLGCRSSGACGVGC